MAYEPTFHFFDPDVPINDPNGPVWFNGRYHTYYQRGRWPKGWGHAVSQDLVRWTLEPPALEADALGSIFSGCTVVDGEELVALFTHHGETEQQSVARSLDGSTFAKHPGNPVLANQGGKDERDPKVVRYGDAWIMVLATGPQLTFYRSDDLLSWEEVGAYAGEPANPNRVFECPALVPVEGDWLLLASVIEPGVPPMGYCLGDFDGATFSPGTPWRRLVHGPDEYATTTFADVPDERTLAIGWLGNWAYYDKWPTGGYQGALSLVRELTVEHGELLQRPVVELDAACRLYSHSLEVPPGNAYRLDLEVRGSATLELMKGPSGCLSMHFDRDAGVLRVDRTSAASVDLGEAFAEVLEYPYVPKDTLNLSVWVDRCLVEVFVDDGVAYAPVIAFPHEGHDGVAVQGRVLDARSYEVGARGPLPSSSP